jgi:hypothetical protein
MAIMKKITGFSPMLLSAIALFNSPLHAQLTLSVNDSITKAMKAMSQDLAKMKKLSITGYIQPQFQHIDSAGAPSAAGGDFVNGAGKYSSRFTMRRGRFKFTYTHTRWAEMVLNADVTEKGLFMRETYAKFIDPWKGMMSLTAGLLQNQFGYEVPYSSASRETPERGRVYQALFPTERDLGLFGTLAFPKKSKLNGLRMDMAVVNGVAGVNPEIDSYKDVCERIQYTTIPRNTWFGIGVGVSAYQGGYRMGNVRDYKLQRLESGDMSYVLNADTNYNRLARREYMGADIQIAFNWGIGTTQLRAEYIKGIQPGTSTSSGSPKAAPTSKLYERNFNGASFHYIQDIGRTKFQFVAKYDWYDPNVKIKGKEVGKTGTNTGNIADIRFDTYGVGLNYLLDKNIRLMCYYDYVINESTSVAGYTSDIKDNVITTRVQFKF